MSSLIGTTLTTRRMQNPETLCYYVFRTLFPLLGYLDNQCGEFLESWMAYLDFTEFSNLIEYYTTIGNDALLKAEYNPIENCTLLKDINNFMYLTQLNFLEDAPNQILQMLNTLILWSKHFYTTIGQYPTLYDFLAITQDELILWEYHLDNPSLCAKLKFSYLHHHHHHCTQGDVASHA